MITDEELEAALERNIEETRKEIDRQLGTNIDPFLAKDMNGRFLLLDAYTALANFRAAKLFGVKYDDSKTI